MNVNEVALALTIKAMEKELIEFSGDGNNEENAKTIAKFFNTICTAIVDDEEFSE